MKELWRDIKAAWRGGDRRERTYIIIAALLLVAEIGLAVNLIHWLVVL